MTPPSIRRRASVRVAVFGVIAFAVLTLRFSPNWVEFVREVREAKSNVASPTQNLAVDRAILSGYSLRGFYVLQQAHDLSTEIDTPVHKIVRWRLLVPVLGHFLHLPGWLILGLPFLGCL